jgi:hypothetical protein
MTVKAALWNCFHMRVLSHDTVPAVGQVFSACFRQFVRDNSIAYSAATISDVPTFAINCFSFDNHVSF